MNKNLDKIKGRILPVLLGFFNDFVGEIWRGYKNISRIFDKG